MTINDLWDEFNRWLDQHGHDEEPGWLTATWEFIGYANGEEVWIELDG